MAALAAEPGLADLTLGKSQYASASGAGEPPTFTSRNRAQLPAAPPAPGVFFFWTIRNVDTRICHPFV